MVWVGRDLKNPQAAAPGPGQARGQCAPWCVLAAHVHTIVTPRSLHAQEFLQLNTKPQHHIHRGSRNLVHGWRREEPSAAFTGQCITLSPLFAGGYKVWGSVSPLCFFCEFSLQSYIRKLPWGKCGSATRREDFLCLFRIAAHVIPKNIYCWLAFWTVLFVGTLKKVKLIK